MTSPRGTAGDDRHRLRPVRRFVALLIGIAIIIGSLLPGEPGWPLMNDKVLHVLAYALWSVTFAVALRTLAHIGGRLAIVALSGGLVELAQICTGREASFADFGANLAGIALGAAAGLVVRAARLRKTGGRIGSGETT